MNSRILKEIMLRGFKDNRYRRINYIFVTLNRICLFHLIKYFSKEEFLGDF